MLNFPTSMPTSAVWPCPTTASAGTAIPSPTSDELVAAQSPYYLHAIECFGPERCMFESNLPVDKLSLSYPVLWNGLKKIAAPFSSFEKGAMFYRTAARLYRL